MAIPIAPNTTCDIYRSTGSPPAAPDVAGVAVYLAADYEQRLEGGESEAGPRHYTHVLLCDPAVDVRDAFNAWSVGLGDKVYVPDQSGTLWRVIFVERRARNTPQDHKRVYLDRAAVAWPSDNL
jgi:hypothetical protein